MRELYGESNNKFNSDYEKTINGISYIIEYENSSRGMVSNLVKILRREPKNCKILFIRTSLHEKKHNADYANFRYLIKHFKIDLLVVCGRNFNPLKNFEDNFRPY